MKTMKKLILFTILVITAVVANAYDFEVDGIYYNISGNNEAIVTYDVIDKSNSNYSGDIAIPQSVTYNGTIYSVTSIGFAAFSDCSGLTSIEIPNSVTSIGYAAFQDCTGLTSIAIPNSVTSIGAHAFNGCTGLMSIDIPNSVTSIGAYSFSSCTGLTSIAIPNSVTSIGYGVFQLSI